jgi:hypothetical protein
MLLASPAGRAELGRWPQYARGAIVTDAQGRCHVKLGVFQFFIFWFAFYVIRGDGGGGDAQGGAYRPQTAGLTQSVRKVRAGGGGGGGAPPPPPPISPSSRPSSAQTVLECESLQGGLMMVAPGHSTGPGCVGPPCPEPQDPAPAAPASLLPPCPSCRPPT